MILDLRDSSCSSSNMLHPGSHLRLDWGCGWGCWESYYVLKRSDGASLDISRDKSSNWPLYAIQVILSSVLSRLVVDSLLLSLKTDWLEINFGDRGHISFSTYYLPSFYRCWTLASYSIRLLYPCGAVHNLPSRLFVLLPSIKCINHYFIRAYCRSSLLLRFHGHTPCLINPVSLLL